MSEVTMKLNKRRQSLFAILLSPLLAATSFVVPAHADEIRIGIVTDLTGLAAYFGEQTRVGTELARRHLARDGKNVKFIIEDTGLNTTRALSAAQKLIFVNKVDALYSDFTTISIPVATVASKNGKVLIYAAAARSMAENSPLVFKTFSDYLNGCYALAKEFLRQGVTKLAVLKPETEFGDLCLEGARNATNVTVQAYRPGDLVDAQMLTFKQRGIEAILHPAFERDVLSALKAVRGLKYPVRLGVPEDSITQQVETSFPAEIEGLLTQSMTLLPEHLLKEAREIEGGERLSRFDAVGLAYVHLRQLVTAIERCPDHNAKLDVSKENCVATKLAAAPAEPLIGFEGWKNRIAQLQIEILQRTDGQKKTVGSYTISDMDFGNRSPQTFQVAP